MKYRFVPCDAEKLRNYILKTLLSDRDSFMLITSKSCDGESDNPYDFCSYYTVTRFHSGDSKFLIIDCEGGEEAFAIPLGCENYAGFDKDDKRIILNYLEKWFKETDAAEETVWVQQHLSYSNDNPKRGVEVCV